MRLPEPTATGIASCSRSASTSISMLAYSAYRTGLPGKMYGSTVSRPAASRFLCTSSPAADHMFSSVTTTALASVPKLCSKTSATEASVSSPMFTVCVSVASRSAPFTSSSFMPYLPSLYSSSSVQPSSFHIWRGIRRSIRSNTNSGLFSGASSASISGVVSPVRTTAEGIPASKAIRISV